MTLAVFICERNDEIGLKKFVWYLFIFNWDYLIEFVSNQPKFTETYLLIATVWIKKIEFLIIEI